MIWWRKRYLASSRNQTTPPPGLSRPLCSLHLNNVPSTTGFSKCSRTFSLVDWILWAFLYRPCVLYVLPISSIFVYSWFTDDANSGSDYIVSNGRISVYRVPIQGGNSDRPAIVRRFFAKCIRNGRLSWKLQYPVFSYTVLYKYEGTCWNKSWT